MVIDTEHNHYLTTTSTFTMVTSKGAYVYDKKTGKQIRYVPEMGFPDGSYHKIAEITAAAATVLTTTSGVKGFDEMQVLATKLLISSVNAMETAISAATTKVEK